MLLPWDASPTQTIRQLPDAGSLLLAESPDGPRVHAPSAASRTTLALIAHEDVPPHLVLAFAGLLRRLDELEARLDRYEALRPYPERLAAAPEGRHG